MGKLLVTLQQRKAFSLLSSELERLKLLSTAQKLTPGSNFRKLWLNEIEDLDQAPQRLWELLALQTTINSVLDEVQTTLASVSDPQLEKLKKDLSDITQSTSIDTILNPEYLQKVHSLLTDLTDTNFVIEAPQSENEITATLPTNLAEIVETYGKNVTNYASDHYRAYRYLRGRFERHNEEVLRNFRSNHSELDQKFGYGLEVIAEEMGARMYQRQRKQKKESSRLFQTDTNQKPAGQSAPSFYESGASTQTASYLNDLAQFTQPQTLTKALAAEKKLLEQQKQDLIANPQEGREPLFSVNELQTNIDQITALEEIIAPSADPQARNNFITIINTDLATPLARAPLDIPILSHSPQTVAKKAAFIRLAATKNGDPHIKNVVNRKTIAGTTIEIPEAPPASDPKTIAKKIITEEIAHFARRLEASGTTIDQINPRNFNKLKKEMVKKIKEALGDNEVPASTESSLLNLSPENFKQNEEFLSEGAGYEQVDLTKKENIPQYVEKLMQDALPDEVTMILTEYQLMASRGQLNASERETLSNRLLAVTGDAQLSQKLIDTFIGTATAPIAATEMENWQKQAITEVADALEKKGKHEVHLSPPHTTGKLPNGQTPPGKEISQPVIPQRFQRMGKRTALWEKFFFGGTLGPGPSGGFSPGFIPASSSGNVLFDGINALRQALSLGRLGVALAQLNPIVWIGVAAAIIIFFIIFSQFGPMLSSFTNPIETGSSGGTQNQFGNGSCPVVGAHSLNPADTPPWWGIYTSGIRGHGTSGYWSAVGGTPSDYAIPDLRMWPQGCYKRADNNGDKCDQYYGMANDVFSLPANRVADVIAPEVCDESNNCVYKWKVIDPARPQDVYIASVDENGEPDGLSKVLLIHVARSVQLGEIIDPGTKVGVLTPCTRGSCTLHAHFELTINGEVADPTPFCDGSSDGGTEPPPGSGYCSVEFLEPIFGSEAKNASCICSHESGGNTHAENRGCFLNKTREHSIGLFQVNLLVHDPPGIDCPSAYNWGGGTQCSVKNQSLLDECVNYMYDAGNNARYAAKLQKSQGWRPWSTAASCGL